MNCALSVPFKGKLSLCNKHVNLKLHLGVEPPTKACACELPSVHVFTLVRKVSGPKTCRSGATYQRVPSGCAHFQDPLGTLGTGQCLGSRGGQHLYDTAVDMCRLDYQHAN